MSIVNASPPDPWTKIGAIAQLASLPISLLSLTVSIVALVIAVRK